MKYLLLLLIPTLCFAQEQVDLNAAGKAEFFISQGVVKTSSNNVAGDSKNWSFDKRELLAIGSYQINNHFDVRGDGCLRGLRKSVW
jgi:hypothetical protein